MSTGINITMKLFEIKQQTKTQEKPDLKFNDDFLKSPKFNAPEKAKEKSAATIKQKVSSGAKTKAKTSGISLPAGAGEKLAALHAAGLEDEISDEEAMQHAGHDPDHLAGYTTKDVHPEDSHALDLPKTPENLPAIVNKQIAKKEPVSPEWHMVKHLPGYLQTPIRALGRAVFKAFTSTPIEDINIIANVNNQGPNSKHEINAVANWIVHHGHEMKDAKMDFAQSIPGYEAEVKVYHALGYTFMLVNDFAGRYIYSWPLSHDKALQSQERLS